jgi:hypothetical protein
MQNQVTPMSYDMDTMLRIPNRQMAEQRLAEENAVRAYNRSLCIDWKTPASETTLACPARNERKAEEAPCDVAPRRVKVPRHEHREDPGICFSVSREFDYTNDNSLIICDRTHGSTVLQCGTRSRPCRTTWIPC